MLKLVTTLLILSLFACSPARDSRLEESRVPDSWKAGANALPKETEAQKLNPTVDRLLATGLAMLEAPSASKGHWKLHGLMLNLGLSANGILGLLIGSGKIGFEAIYGRSDEQPPARLDSASPQTLDLPSKNGELTVPPQFEATLRELVAQGRLHDENRLKENIRAPLAKFQELVRAAASVPNELNGDFYLHGLQLEVAFDAEGRLVGSLGVGGEIGFRLNWVNERTAPRAGVPRTAFGQTARQNLTALVTTLSNELEQMTKSSEASSIESSGYRLMEIKPWIGVSAQGELGIVSASTDWQVMLRFHRKSAPSQTGQPRAPAADAIPLFAEGKIIRGNRHEFGKGLKRAMRIASFFAKRAKRARTSKWKLKEFSPSFEVSARGSVGLVSVEGNPGLEITFVAKE